MGSIQYACKTIANLVSRAGISDLTGLQVWDRQEISAEESRVSVCRDITGRCSRSSSNCNGSAPLKDTRIGQP